MNEDLLTIIEKRKWLAEIFRNDSGEYCQSDRFKALIEDTKLATIQKEEEEISKPSEKPNYADKIYALFKGVPSPDPAVKRSSS